MYHIITRAPEFARDYIRFLHEYIGKKSWAEILKEVMVFDDSCITDYNIFKSVADFACKNMNIDRLPVSLDLSRKFYYYELKPDHRLYYYMMQNWTYDLNKYIMSKFDGNWVYIPKNKYTLER